MPPIILDKRHRDGKITAPGMRSETERSSGTIDRLHGDGSEKDLSHAEKHSSVLSYGQ